MVLLSAGGVLINIASGEVVVEVLEAHPGGDRTKGSSKTASDWGYTSKDEW